ncbi:MAG: hypothetical protein PSX81_06665 [bacterium]|nr:hypothetical protein [bacterium]
MSKIYDDNLSMCEQSSQIKIPNVGDFTLWGKFLPVDQKWKYTLEIGIIVPNLLAIVTVNNRSNLIPGQNCNPGDLNCLSENITIELGMAGNNSAFLLGYAAFQPCCPDSDPKKACLNCDQSPRGQCGNMQAPNMTPILLDLKVTIKVNGATLVTNKKIPYDKARHDG